MDTPKRFLLLSLLVAASSLYVANAYSMATEQGDGTTLPTKPDTDTLAPTDTPVAKSCNLNALLEAIKNNKLHTTAMLLSLTCTASRNTRAKLPLGTTATALSAYAFYNDGNLPRATTSATYILTLWSPEVANFLAEKGLIDKSRAEFLAAHRYEAATLTGITAGITTWLASSLYNSYGKKVDKKTS